MSDTPLPMTDETIYTNLMTDQEIIKKLTAALEFYAEGSGRDECKLECDKHDCWLSIMDDSGKLARQVLAEIASEKNNVKV